MDNPISKEYDGERDMAHFWRVVRPLEEPTRRRWYLPAIAGLSVLTVPCGAVRDRLSPVVGGLPLWVWVSLSFSLLIACLTAYGALCLWKDVDLSDESRDERQ